MWAGYSTYTIVAHTVSISAVKQPWGSCSVHRTLSGTSLMRFFFLGQPVRDIQSWTFSTVLFNSLQNCLVCSFFHIKITNISRSTFHSMNLDYTQVSSIRVIMSLLETTGYSKTWWTVMPSIMLCFLNVLNLDHIVELCFHFQIKWSSLAIGVRNKLMRPLCFTDNKMKKSKGGKYFL